MRIEALSPEEEIQRWRKVTLKNTCDDREKEIGKKKRLCGQDVESKRRKERSKGSRVIEEIKRRYS